MKKLIQKFHQVINNKKIMIPSVMVILVSGTLLLKNCSFTNQEVKEIHVHAEETDGQDLKKQKAEQVLFQGDIEGITFVLDESINRLTGFRKQVKVKITNPFSYSFQIYSNDTCTQLVQAYEEDITPEMEFSIEVPKMDLENKYYMAVMDKDGGKSECLPGPSYAHKSCPKGFVPVIDYGLKEETDFCVMQTEAKEDGEGKAYSAFDDKIPWNYINAKDARQACLDLGEGFDIMSNDYYMIMAKRIEDNPKNWLHGFVGDGAENGQPNCLYLGNIYRDHIDYYYSECTVSGGTAGAIYSDTVPMEGELERRKLYLDDEVFVYDFLGNLSEFVDFYPGNDNIDGYNGDCEIVRSVLVAGLKESDVGCGDDIFEENVSPRIKKYDDDKLSRAMGRMVIKRNAENTVVATRGGGNAEDERVGLYSLFQHHLIRSEEPYVGFRCTYKNP